MLETIDGGWRGRFKAMASPCEVLVRNVSHQLARKVLSVVADEAGRIEQKFSRYRDDNIIYQLNNAAGDWTAVDEETERLLNYADTCYRLSAGRFDVTSGVLRRAWVFDGSDRIPDSADVQALLGLVGWQKVERHPGAVRLPAGMELDFGGIGKEYAVDRALALACHETDQDLLVNFGGDLAARAVTPWLVGLEGLTNDVVSGTIEISNGAIATSGDARRFLLRDGVRYSHVLDPHTGWPVMGAPRSVTVLSGHCTQAGILSTLALLQGAAAEDFLRQQEVRYWLQWQ